MTISGVGLMLKGCAVKASRVEEGCVMQVTQWNSSSVPGAFLLAPSGFSEGPRHRLCPGISCGSLETPPLSGLLQKRSLCSWFVGGLPASENTPLQGCR